MKLIEPSIIVILFNKAVQFYSITFLHENYQTIYIFIIQVIFTIIFFATNKLMVSKGLFKNHMINQGGGSGKRYFNKKK